MSNNNLIDIVLCDVYLVYMFNTPSTPPNSPLIVKKNTITNSYCTSNSISRLWSFYSDVEIYFNCS